MWAGSPAGKRHAGCGAQTGRPACRPSPPARSKTAGAPKTTTRPSAPACTTTDGVPPAAAGGSSRGLCLIGPTPARARSRGTNRRASAPRCAARPPGHRLKLRAHGRKIVLRCRGGLPAVLSGGRRFLRHRGRAERQNQKYSQKGHADAAHKPHRAFPLHSKSPCLAAAVQPLPRYVKRLQIHNTCYNLVTF